MSFTKTALAFGTCALGLMMAASSYHVTISNPTWVAGNELKPGDYRVEIQDGKAMFKEGKTTVEVPAKLATADKKYPTTATRSDDVNGKQQLQEIQLGGTKTSILFNTGSTGAGGSE